MLEGDEQLDRPKCEACMECCHACAALYFWSVTNATAYHLGRYSLHLLVLLMTSMVTHLASDPRFELTLILSLLP